MEEQKVSKPQEHYRRDFASSASVSLAESWKQFQEDFEKYHVQAGEEEYSQREKFLKTIKKYEF